MNFCFKKTSMNSPKSKSQENSVNGTQNLRVALGSGSSVAAKVVNRRNPHNTANGVEKTKVRRKKHMKSTVELNIGTWNVRTLGEAGKIDNVIQEMNRLNINVLGIAETRWPGSGKITKENGYTFLYSGGNSYQHGVGILLDKHSASSLKCFIPISERLIMVKIKGSLFDINIIQVYLPTSTYSDEDVDEVYDIIEDILRQTKNNEVTFVIGDMNAKVGRGKDAKEVGPYGLGCRNERGEKLIEFCRNNDLCVANTMFNHHPRHLYTWTAPSDDETERKYNCRNQIDYLLVPKRFRNGIMNARTFPGADCNSDHELLVMRVKIKLKKLKQAKGTPKPNLDLLGECPLLKLEFAIKTENKFNALAEISSEENVNYRDDVDIEQSWLDMKEILVTSADEVLGKKKKTKNAPWMTDKILELMDERRQFKRNEVEYKKYHKEIQRLCRKEKEKWLNTKCEEAEQLLKQNKDREMHKKIKELTYYKKSNVSGGVIKTKDGKMCYEIEDRLARWVEYIDELYGDSTRNDAIDNSLYSPLEDEPTILMSELRVSLEELAKRKSAGPDEVGAELLQSMDENGRMALLRLLNKIYMSGYIPRDFKRSIFVALPKKTNANECKDFRTISLMSHTMKLLLKIIQRRIHTKLENEIAEEQFGFRSGNGTRDGIFALHNLCERAIEMQKDVYVCFIDYEKAFDRVQHGKMMDLLERQNIGKNNLQLIRNLYWTQEAAIRIEDVNSDWTSIKRGVRQGCVISPLLFNFYTEFIMRESNIDYGGIQVGGRRISNLRYADDTVLIAESEEILQEMLNKTNDVSKSYGLSLNAKKTKVMAITKKAKIGELYGLNIKVCNQKIEEVDNFTYLGSCITNTAKNTKEIKIRIAKAKNQFYKIGKFVTNKNVSLNTRKRIVACYVWSVLLYGAETWTLNPDTTKRLNSFEIWCYRRMLRISWTKKVSNETVLERVKEKRMLMNKVKNRKLSYCGHVLRHKNVLNDILLGKVAGRRSRGRKRRTWINDVEEWTGMSLQELKEKALDRQEWRKLVHDLCTAEM